MKVCQNPVGFIKVCENPLGFIKDRQNPLGFDKSFARIHWALIEGLPEPTGL